MAKKPEPKPPKSPDAEGDARPPGMRFPPQGTFHGHDVEKHVTPTVPRDRGSIARRPRRDPLGGEREQPEEVERPMRESNQVDREPRRPDEPHPKHAGRSVDGRFREV